MARPAQTDSTARAARVKAALKANMARRKAQARARAEIEADAEPGHQGPAGAPPAGRED
ncbi:MAG: hypothetical protein ACU0BF_05460 [Paracoccaceae bacterium]